MPDYQSYYRCNHCWQVYIGCHEKGDPDNASIRFQCRRLEKPCEKNASFQRLPDDEEGFTGWFRCMGFQCGERVAMAVRDGFSFQTLYHARCGGKLVYVASGPGKSITSYEESSGWQAICSAMEVDSTQAERDSQKNVRAYLIKKGYFFLGGQLDGNIHGSLSTTDFKKVEFTTYHPTYSIEEPGFQSYFGTPKVVVLPRLMQNLSGVRFVNTTWPDFVVWDGTEKLAIELKTPKTYIQGGDDRPWKIGGSLDHELKKLVVSERTLGYAARWLLQYAADIHREAQGRKQHSPKEYRHMFLVDLTATGEEPEDVWTDLVSLANSSERNGKILSVDWWKSYWDEIGFFYGGEIVDTKGIERNPGKLLTYDQIAQVFQSTTVCSKCRDHIPTRHRSESGLCLPCTLLTQRKCFRCRSYISDIEWGEYPVCKFCWWSARLLCNHQKYSHKEKSTGICVLCLANLLSLD